jgi:hypothetical protein
MLSMRSSSSISETMSISRERFGHRSGSASYTFLINSRHFLEGMRRGSWAEGTSRHLCDDGTQEAIAGLEALLVGPEELDGVNGIARGAMTLAFGHGRLAPPCRPV